MMIDKAKINITKINIVLSTLNFVLPFIGYQLATTLLLPMSSDVEGISRIVTIPYRAFALFVSLSVLFLNRSRKVQLSKSTILLLFYWSLLLVRMFYDLELRYDFYVLPAEKSRIWLYALFICFVTMFSVLKSITKIDIQKGFKWIYLLTTLAVLIMIFANESIFAVNDESVGRLEGGVALNTISFGHLGVLYALMSFYILKTTLHYKVKLFALLALLLGIFVMLRAGSRGPFLSFTVCLLFYYVSINRKFIGVFLTSISILAILYLIKDFIFGVIELFSVTMYNRLSATIESGNAGAREQLYDFAINTFLDNPMFGGQFALNNNGILGYSHNFILDAFMGLGLIGGIIYILITVSGIVVSRVLIKSKLSYWWISLILIQNIMGGMTSSAFYYNPLLSVLLVIVFQKKSILPYLKFSDCK